MHDLVIRNGTIVDGSGRPRFRADIGIDKGRITSIGRLNARGQTDVDADGLLISPGFIDVHTHMDAQILWDRIGSSICWHGVTTAVMGHCGFSLAPVRSSSRSLVLQTLERAEAMPAETLAAGVHWAWTGFGEYLEAIDRLQKGINYVANVGHSALRTFVMGERALSDAATPIDIELMRLELISALKAGAFGLSTSRTDHHLMPDGRVVPSVVASSEELLALAKIVGDYRGVLQIQAPSAPEDQAAFYADVRTIANEFQALVVLSAVGPFVDQTVTVLDNIASEGGRAIGLTHCRGIGSLLSFATQLPFDVLKEWEPVRSLPRDQQIAALRNPLIRERLIRSARDGGVDGVGASPRAANFDRMYRLETPLPPHRSVTELAAQARVSPPEYMIDVAIQDFDALYFQPNAPFDHDQTREVMLHPATVMGFSDAGAHVWQMSDASLPTYLLAHWVRDRQDLTIEQAIRMLTSEPARGWGLVDRGILQDGAIADINVFDPEVVGPEMPKLVYDLPAQQPRFIQRARGFMMTIVSGEIVHINGNHTDVYPGHLIRSSSARGFQ